MKITIAVADLTMAQIVDELAIARQDILRLEPTNARALDTIRQAAKAIMGLCEIVEKQQGVIHALDAQAGNAIALLQSTQGEGN